MGNDNIFTIAVAILTIIGSVVGVWAVTRKNASEVAKAKALGEVNAQAAETQERADLIAMIKEGTKQGAIWLESLKIIERQRETDYAATKNLIEDGTLETINSRKEVIKGVESLGTKANEHHTDTTNLVNEVRKEIGAIKKQVDAIPGAHQEIMKRLDVVLGSVEMLRPKRVTNELPAMVSSNGTVPESPSAILPT